ncbi:uncharacterized protein LOC143216052 [Lasioglossum baleicum]|uniref:uncharacterized protein LOC143216052 n=1 Tax=Lasioglossum baleicum TaxID=434251 RepID=UPI003FCEAD3F
MPHPCVVCGRSRMNPNNREEEYMFFGFPVNDESRCRKWLEFCCREDLYKLTKKQLLQRMVCSKHFDKKDFLNDYFDRLNGSAVPTVYDPKQSLYNITCVLCGHSRRDPPSADYDGATFHHFPGEEFRCLKWLDFVGVDSYYRLTRKEILFCYICSKHFDDSQFMSGYTNRLIDNAVPNIRNADQLESPEQYIMEFVDVKSYVSLEKPKKLEPLSPAVLDSQACAACGRLRSDPRNKLERYKFHPFPAYEIGRCLRWCQFLGESFHKVGPCDAVPTIKDVSEADSMNPTEQIEEEQDVMDESNCTNTAKGIKRQGFTRPLVSSKKPKVDNKPTPLAKKRGKSKRPTLINIPRPDPNNIENRMIRKLPLPPNSNWKIQFTDQIQPITIANNIAQNITNNIQGNIKKVILPFAGDISNLGDPIPVHSLSSIPPGLLIKINLPGQEPQKPVKMNKKPTKTKTTHSPATSNEIGTKHQVWINDGTTSDSLPMIKPDNQDEDKNFVEFLSISPEETEDRMTTQEMNVHEEMILPHSLEVLDEEVDNVNHNDHFYQDFEVVESLSPKEARPAPRKKVSGTMRRTIMPIKSEVRYFLRKLAPYTHRLPKKARAQIKLSIVNMVIDQL